MDTKLDESNNQPAAESRPPALPPAPAAALEPLLALLLSVGLGLFLADAVLSLADDTLILLLNSHLLSGLRGMVFFFAALGCLVIYGLMALTPLIPKRVFVPVALFNPLAMLVALPLMIFFYPQIKMLAWAISLCQVLFAFGMLRVIQGGGKLRWPLVGENLLAGRGFSWRNLVGFVGVNVFVLGPAVVVYLAVCASLALAHFSDGFLALRPGGLTVQVRNYVRADGKTIRLIPMSHIADAAFYQRVEQSFPTNAIILLEGVTDRRNLLTNKISYQRAAASLGLTEQVKEFRPTQGELVPADVDVEQFSTQTIGFLNLVMLLHRKGMTDETLQQLAKYSPPPQVESLIIDDLLGRRNEHLLGEIRERLAETEHIIVPWGAAHMPELAREIVKAGFHLQDAQEYTVIRFRGAKNKKDNVRPPEVPPKPK